MKVTPSDQILAQDIENEIVLLNTQTGRYFGLAANGQRIWQLLTELGDTEMAIEALRLEYDVEEATLRQDVEELVEKLVETGLITVNETSS